MKYLYSILTKEYVCIEAENEDKAWDMVNEEAELIGDRDILDIEMVYELKENEEYVVPKKVLH